MQGPDFSRIGAFLLFRDERFPEDFLKLSIVVEHLDLHQLLLCLSMLMLKHFFGSNTRLSIDLAFVRRCHVHAVAKGVT